VTSALRVMGLSQEQQFQNFHRVLNRATWSSHAVSGVLLRLLLAAFVPTDAPIVFGLDDHIERCRGAKIAARGIYRDAVRSSKSFFVKTSGLRWVCKMLLITCSKANNLQPARPPGTQRRRRRFPLPWPSYGNTCGSSTLFGCRPTTPTLYRFQGRYSTA